MSKDQEINEMSAVQVNGIVFSHKDISKVVDAFYRKVEHDSILKVPFRSVHDWPEHIKRLTHFWWIRFGGKPYMFSHYNPVTKHYFAGFNQEFLSHWLKLFHQTLNEKLSPQQAMIWKTISEQMGRGLSIRNEHFKKEYENERFKSNH